MIPKITFLYTNVGRGHPFYLDGIRAELQAHSQGKFDCQVTDVFAESRGTALSAWKVARWLYHQGSSGGVIGSVYDKLRSGQSYNRPSTSLSIMSRDLRASAQIMDRPVVVAHPSLVGALKGHQDIYYQHGEAVVPDEAVVRDAGVVFVPTEDAASLFLGAGYAPDQVIVSGLCIERSLLPIATQAFGHRRDRLRSGGPLTGLFISSGAEPKQHLATIQHCVQSLDQPQDCAVIVAKAGGRLERLVSRSGAELFTYDSRAELEALTTELFPRLDYIVSPAHERTNWALGLGLPIFVLTPTVGPFAALNLKLIESQGVGVRLPEGVRQGSFRRFIAETRNSGHLLSMSERGWGYYPINGFQTIANSLIDRLI